MGELNSLRFTSQNINSAIETVTTCQYILGLCAKVKEYVENRKFYPAIKVRTLQFTPPTLDTNKWPFYDGML